MCRQVSVLNLYLVVVVATTIREDKMCYHSNKVSPKRDVKLLARRVLPLVSYVAYASVTDDDRRH